MTSSLRNSLHRRNHKERPQLANRNRLGILEKHKDYVLRARDYHSKQQRLQRLRERAVQRNKDEFYFAMKAERSVGGVHIKDRGNTALPVDIVKALKAQDENYLRTKRALDLKKIQRLRTQLGTQADFTKLEDKIQELLDEEDKQLLSEGDVPLLNHRVRRTGRKRQEHITFVEGTGRDEKEQADGYGRKEFSPDLGWTDVENRDNNIVGEDSSKEIVQCTENEDEMIEYRLQLLRELAARLKRQRLLRFACRELEMQRLLMAKGGKQKLSGVEAIEVDDREDDKDEDELDSRKGRCRPSPVLPVDERAYKPRVYKWRLERKG